MSTLAQRSEEYGNSLYNLSAAAPRERLALLLSGGDGRRLQEFTAQLTGVPIPKQYCPLMRGNSLLELALFRARHFAPIENTRVIVNQNHLGLARNQLRGLPEGCIFVQPENRDTGPGIIFALTQIARTSPDAIVAVFPTDHFIDDETAFGAHVLRAACMVHQFPRKIAILGVTPDHPETDYGYIMPGRPLCRKSTHWRVSRVKAFREKPCPAMARELISHGGLWNTFILVFQLKRMLKLLRQMAPKDSRRLFNLQDHPREALAIYRDIHPWNFSTQILAHIPEELIVLEMRDVHWSDWGTQESIERTFRNMNLVPAWRPRDYASVYETDDEEAGLAAISVDSRYENDQKNSHGFQMQ